MTHDHDEFVPYSKLSHLITANERHSSQPQPVLDPGEAVDIAELLADLKSPDRQARWEAVKTLTRIKVPAAAPDLVEAMNDEVFRISWLAADALIMLGADALEPLLRMLLAGHESVWFRHGAYRIIRSLCDPSRPYLKPVFEALEGIEPQVSLPVAAHEALWAMQHR